MLDSIENLQRQFTDKYVVVDEAIPELARFGGHVGQVKTINMNGRALVQFDAWNNIGWYDIEVDCLKVVDPAEFEAKKAEAKKEAAKPAAKAAPAAAAKPAAAAGGGAKKSTADILAAARANKSGAAAPAPKPAGDKPAAAKPAGGKMSTADILAAARAKKAAEGAPAAEASSVAVEEAEAEPASTPEATLPEGTGKPAKAGGGTSLPTGRRPTVPEILAWCRAHDAK